MPTTPSQLDFTKEVETTTIGDTVPNPPAGSLTLFPNQNNLWYLKTSAGVVTPMVPAFTAEDAQDAVGGILLDSSSIDFTYDDAANTITAVVITEAIQDIVGALIAASDATLTVTYNDAGNTLTIGVGTITSAKVSDFTEAAQDAAGALFADSSTLDVTYNDAGNAETARTLNPFVSRVTAASKTYALTDNGQFYERINGGAAMTDTLPTPSAGDNGLTIGVHNIGTTPAETITFTGAGGEVIGSVATSYILQYGCRQTFVWTGTKWLFGAGNGNLVKTPSVAPAAGDIAAFLDVTGRQLVKATSANLAAASNDRLAVVNILDYGADNTGAVSITTALNNAIAALPSGGVVMFPPGVYLETSSPYVVSANNVRLWAPAGSNATILKTTNTTGDQFRLTGYGCSVVGFNIQGPGTGTTSNKTGGIGLDVQSVEGAVNDCSFAYHFEALRVGGTLVDVDNVWVRYFKANGIVVDHNSDHRITRVSMVNNAATLPTGGGIDVRVTASLVLDNLNIIASNFPLNISPTTGVTVPSVKATNCFFDTSAVGLNMTGAGSVFRSEFTNCWFSSMTTAGIRIQPAAGGSVDGITFVNCDIYNNVAGTTNGVLLGGGAGNVGKVKVSACSLAGWTNAVNISATGVNVTFLQLLGNTIGAVSAFTANTVGILVATGSYKGLVIQGNDVVDNTTALTLGTVTLPSTAYGSFRIIDNPGINPRGTVTPPIATPVTATTYTNNTGFRVNVFYKGATLTSHTINGVAYAQASIANQVHAVTLDPGSTIAIAGTTLTWSWAAH